MIRIIFYRNRRVIKLRSGVCGSHMKNYEEDISRIINIDQLREFTQETILRDWYIRGFFTSWTEKNLSFRIDTRNSFDYVIFHIFIHGRVITIMITWALSLQGTVGHQLEWKKSTHFFRYHDEKAFVTTVDLRNYGLIEALVSSFFPRSSL